MADTSSSGGMGMPSNPYSTAAGAVLDIGGNAMLGEAAEGHLDLFDKLRGQLPVLDPSRFTGDYFGQLSQYLGPATDISRSIAQSDLTTALGLREQALPGIGEATRGAMSALTPLLQGNLPPSILANFQRAGGASAAGMGFGGSGFGFLNTGLFGARGALGAMQAGMGMLPSLLSAMPHLNSPSPSTLLGNIMSPNQVANMRLVERQQDIGMNEIRASMPNRMDVWGAGLKQAGASLMGSGGSGNPNGFGSFGGYGGSSSVANYNSSVPYSGAPGTSMVDPSTQLGMNGGGFDASNLASFNGMGGGFGNGGFGSMFS